MPEIAVLDSSAILAVLKAEPGAGAVLPVLRGGLLSSVNLAEIHARLLAHGMPAAVAWKQIIGLGCEIYPFSAGNARVAAELILVTKPYGLSLGDRACLALAMEQKATVYTADRAWQSLGLSIDIEVIR